ncbi:hypothetical protein KBA41_03950 [Candidatus Ozemobacteraceae bacterium]|nr:hypothetical protein [Candidatus Ozemobacteraceae bacterium]
MKYMYRYIMIFVLAAAPAFADAPGWYPLEGPEAARVLVPGERPLTMGQANVFFNCIEFAFGVAMTQAEQETVRTALMQEYLQLKGDLLDDLKDVGSLWKDVCASPLERRGQYRVILKDVFLGESKKEPRLGISQAISGISAQELDVIGAGTPPVTKRSLAAFIELVQMALKLRDRRVVAWDDSTRKAVEAAVLTRLAALPPAGRNWLANADIHRALTVRGWQDVAADERDAINRLLVETFAPAPASGSALPVDVDAIPIPPPNLFQLPTDLPWPMR